MIYKLDNLTGVITTVSSEEARRALEAYGWTKWSIDDFFRSAKVLCDMRHDYCRFRDRLEELKREKSEAVLATSLAARGLKLAEVRGW